MYQLLIESLSNSLIVFSYFAKSWSLVWKVLQGEKGIAQVISGESRSLAKGSANSNASSLQTVLSNSSAFAELQSIYNFYTSYN